MGEEKRVTPFGLVETLVVVFVIGMFLALMLSTGGGARPPAFNAQCKSNLRQIGLAMNNYVSVHGCYPPGAVYGRAESGRLTEPQLDPREFQATGFELMLAYMEQQQIINLRARRPWYQQSPMYLAAVIPSLICPASSDAVNPTSDLYYQRLGLAVGTPFRGPFARTDYIFCKGVSDAWCLTPGNILPWDKMPAGDKSAVATTERGMFDIVFPAEFELPGGPFIVTAASIVDGASNTIAAGEGAPMPLGTHGSRNDRGSADDPINPREPLTRTEALQFWAIPPNTSAGTAQGLYMASIFGVTLEPLNTLPVTHTVIELAPADLMNARASFDYDGPQGPAQGGGVHRTSGFRSQHRGGANFVFADGSVQWVSDSCDMQIYRAMSTIAGGEAVTMPQRRGSADLCPTRRSASYNALRHLGRTERDGPS